MFEKLRSGVVKRLKCALDQHRPERLGIREVDGVWQSHCLDCQRMVHRVDDIWRSLHKSNLQKHRRR